MIENLKCNCYCNNSCVPTRYYIKVTNNGELSIKYILQYGIYGGTTTKQINLSKGQYQKYAFPEEAINVCLNILNISLPMTSVIYHECILDYQNICYEIKGTAQSPICIKSFC